MSKEKSKKAEPTKSVDETVHAFIRIARVKVPNSHHAAYQIEKVAVCGERVIHRAFYGNPDMLEMILAKVQEALDPESVVTDGPPVTAVA